MARRPVPIIPFVEDVRRSYDEVAERYAAELSDELEGKPLDRGLLDAMAEFAGAGLIVDVGAGPGHVGAYLVDRGTKALALDLSSKRCALARRAGGLPAVTADMAGIPLASSSVTGVVCLYAVIHLDDRKRARAYSEFARILRPGGHLLVSFHVCDDDTPPGGQRHLREWWEHQVDLVFRFLDPMEELAALARLGLEFVARLERQPHVGVEHPSRRAYLLFRRPASDPR